MPFFDINARADYSFITNRETDQSLPGREKSGPLLS